MVSPEQLELEAERLETRARHLELSAVTAVFIVSCKFKDTAQRYRKEARAKRDQARRVRDDEAQKETRDW